MAKIFVFTVPCFTQAIFYSYIWWCHVKALFFIKLWKQWNFSPRKLFMYTVHWSLSVMIIGIFMLSISSINQMCIFFMTTILSLVCEDVRPYIAIMSFLRVVSDMETTRLADVISGFRQWRPELMYLILLTPTMSAYNFRVWLSRWNKNLFSFLCLEMVTHLMCVHVHFETETPAVSSFCVKCSPCHYAWWNWQKLFQLRHNQPLILFLHFSLE